jgi:flagellar biosynthesis protein FliQ
MDELLADIANEGFALLTLTSAPFLTSVLVAGLIMGVIQAATQVNDPAVGFLPRAVVGIAVAWSFGPTALEELAAFFTSSIMRMSGGGP